MLWGGVRGQYLGHHRCCLITWRLADGWILYWICWFSVTQTLTWISVCRSVTYISWSSDFALYTEDYLMDKCHNLEIGSMWCRFTSSTVCGSVTYISWSSDFVISWRLFDGWMLYWRYWFSVTQTLTLNYICRSVTYISRSSDFALYLEDYFQEVWGFDLRYASHFRVIPGFTRCLGWLAPNFYWAVGFAENIYGWWGPEKNKLLPGGGQREVEIIKLWVRRAIQKIA